MIVQVQVGDILEMKKQHPCGSNKWELTRVGMDFRMKCLGCGREVMVSRVKAERNIKKVIKKTVEE